VRTHTHTNAHSHPHPHDIDCNTHQQVAEIKDESTVHDLVGGKSATQNELIGDFEEEFGELAEGSAERPLVELAKGFAG
jgi:3-oxoacyl-ACP reductase-like protein